MTINKISIHHLVESTGIPDLFVRRESFEERAEVVLRALLGASPDHTSICSIRSRGRASSVDASRFMRADLLEIAIDDPVGISAVLRECAQRVAELPADAVTLVDITAFRREELLILLRMLAHHSRPDSTVFLVYVPAASYADDWLSRGVIECRPVVGFPGNHGAAEPDHLVLMLGFELDRAQALVDFYEPARVSIGRGSFSRSILPQFYERNQRVFDAFLAYAVPSEANQFEFAPEDPLGTAEAIEAALSSAPGHNHIIAPLNNKISVLGAGLVGLKRPEVQVCYAAAAEYNESGYSTPADYAYVMRLNELLRPAI